MQYHLNGFRSGDPAIQPQADQAASDNVDVAIIGCGPAGLTLAAQLAQFPEISTRIFETKPGPLELGQADGIACRSMEMFEAFGFAHKVLREAYWVNETVFWRPDGAGKTLARAERIDDVEEGLSEMPHTILNQARVHDFYLDTMAHSPTRLVPDYDCALARVENVPGPHPLRLTFHSAQQPGTQKTVHARYLVGCDGARSSVRKHLGYGLEGAAARQLWGVMDVLAITDFPDIRLKAAIQSADHGSLLIIPREGGYLVRMYIELGTLQGDERASDRDVSPQMLIDKARAILAPYSLEVAEVAWWSAYEIGQRVCHRFDDAEAEADPQIFIAGDACHTHSPKAGQGMNVSMADTFNLGWKLAMVLRGQARPDLLRSYSAERQAKAQELIDFDRDMARLFSARSDSPESAAEFQAYFQKHGRYTAGVETTYAPSLLVKETQHQDLATGFALGKRFHSAPVIRLADAKPMQLGHALRADGRWRLMVFAPQGDDGQQGGAVAKLCAGLEATGSAMQRLCLPGQDVDSGLDLRAVFQTPHRELEHSQMPALLRPAKGRYGLTDYEKVYCPDPKADIFDLRGIDRDKGAMVLIRPDQFVAMVLPLDQVAMLNPFFDGFLAR